MSNANIGEVYRSKKDEDFFIAMNQDGSCHISKLNTHGQYQLIFKASKSWTLEQAKKFCEL
jgi:hypothetical protein